MEPEKSKLHITTKPAAQPGAGGKSETVEDDKAALVRGGRLPSYLQRAGSTAAEEEKEKMILKQKAIQLQRLSSTLFSESEKKK